MIPESEGHSLDRREILEICRDVFFRWNLKDTSILCIIPDNTRSCPMDRMFRIVYELLADSVKKLDFLVALGTHPPLREEDMYRRVGITVRQYRYDYPKARFFNHEWRNPDHLTTIGTLSEDEIVELSGGRMHERVELTVNKSVLDYDRLLIIGPTFPHEVAGFSGGNKYLFPGIAGEEIIHLFHWLGALITSPVIIGVKETPVRRVIDRAASFLPTERLCLSMVVRGNDLLGLYAGTPEEASSKAADHSEEVHIIHKNHPFEKVLSCAPRMYNDLWTGAKCMYKLEPVVADGGELIIYAPHIAEVSVTHGKDIEGIGYHVRDYFLKQPDRFRHVSGCVKAHATHVRGVGTYEDGSEKPRIRVTLATGIPESLCRKINLGYRDPESIQPEEWKDREEEGILFVPNAGEMLYRLKNDPFRNA
jgi:nickel-dependent lactate racemase